MSRREPVEYLEPHQRGSCAKCGSDRSPKASYHGDGCYDRWCSYHMKDVEHLHVRCFACGYVMTMETKDAA